VAIMDTLQAILTRISVRKFSGREISQEALRRILEAGMSGPSCVNSRDWSFVVVRDREMLNKMADANGRPAQPLRSADVGILVCGDLQRAFAGAPDYWVIDGAIAAQNLTVAAEALGLGSVWLGTWPQMQRVTGQAELFGLPEHIVPHSILAFGYPADERELPLRDHWEEDRIHWEKW